MKKTRGALIGAVAFFALVSGSVPAVAGTDPETDPEWVSDGVVQTEPPAEPEEPVTDVANPDTEPQPSADDKPTDFSGVAAGYECRSGGVYLPKTKGGKYHRGVGATQSNYNGTSRTARSTFTADVSGEVGVSVSHGLQVSVNAMIGQIEGKFDVNLSAKLTAKIGNSISVDTPPHKRTNAKYGVYRLKNTGVSYVSYSNCATSTKRTVTSYTPYRVGWYLWEN
ncbi:hypothetical protein [Streptomyces niger]|uniref:hypothetical protein n=1 Tax=Streptomyces niger TaxID=66373 RepID=UPI0018FEEE9E|nr:hypothetical protein [Streptomyces niger]